MEDALRAKGRRHRLRLSFRQILLLLIAAVAAFSVAAAVYTYLRDDDTAPSVRVITGVQFPYPAGWSEQPLTDDDKTAGLVLKLERRNPEASFLARTVVARLAPGFDINQLSADSQRALSSEIEGFDPVSNDVKLVAGMQAVQIRYSQADEGDGRFQTLMTIIPMPNQTFYLTMRTGESEYDRAEAEGVQLMDTFAAYVNSASQQPQ
jgi:hypothetical protein